MFDTKPTPLRAASQPTLSACHIVRPWVNIRPATRDEIFASRVWTSINQPGDDHPDVAEFRNGRSDHAPEVISAFRAQSEHMPADFTLIYLHRGVQPQCVNPLLPSFLHLTGHDGPSYALRRDGQDRLTPEIERFARAMTPSGSAALIVDDRQLRLTPRGRMRAAEVHFHMLIKPGLARELETGAFL